MAILTFFRLNEKRNADDCRGYGGSFNKAIDTKTVLFALYKIIFASFGQYILLAIAFSVSYRTFCCVIVLIVTFLRECKGLIDWSAISQDFSNCMHKSAGL